MLNPIGKAEKARKQGFEAVFENDKNGNPFQYAPRKLMYLASWWDKGYTEGKAHKAKIIDKAGKMGIEME